MGAVLLQAWGEERCLLLWPFVSEKKDVSVLTLVQKHEDKPGSCVVFSAVEAAGRDVAAQGGRLQPGTVS